MAETYYVVRIPSSRPFTQYAPRSIRHDPEPHMEAKLNELKTRLLEVNDLNSANALLGWDQTTYMPTGGAAARGRQMATLSRLAHEKFTDPAIGRLLDDLRPYEESLPYDSDDASLIRVTRREYERAVKVPSAFVAELTEPPRRRHIRSGPRRARRMTSPRCSRYLEKTLDLSRQLADYFPPYEHIADPLIDIADYGMKVVDGPAALRRAARPAGADRPGHHRAAARRRRLPAPALPGASAVGLRPSR